MRKRLFGVEPTTRLAPDAYRQPHAIDVDQHLRQRAAPLIRTGRTVIANATFLDPLDRTRTEDLAADLNVLFRVLERRIRERRSDTSDADVEVLTKQFDCNIGGVSWRVISSGNSAADVVVSVRSSL